MYKHLWLHISPHFGLFFFHIFPTCACSLQFFTFWVVFCSLYFTSSNYNNLLYTSRACNLTAYLRYRLILCLIFWKVSLCFQYISSFRHPIILFMFSNAQSCYFQQFLGWLLSQMLFGVLIFSFLIHSITKQKKI